MKQAFEPLKAAQAAAVLIQLAGGTSNYTKLLKLLYLADRQSLLETGSTITGDNVVNMKNGPVLSKVYDCIKGSTLVPCPEWSNFIGRSGRYDVSVVESPGDSKLSDYDVEVLTALHERYAASDFSAMIVEVHRLPEWKDPGAGREPLSYDQILEAGHTPPEVIAAFQALNEAARSLDSSRAVGA
jgi:uncharacterized phage-associated protein